jgi:hypothetical protein
MRRLALSVLVVGLLLPVSQADADPGTLNLHIDLAGELPVAGYYAFPSRNENSARVGARLGAGLDYVISGPLALEALFTVGYLFETDDDFLTAGGQSESGSLTASAAIGARLRLLESKRLWLSAHLGYHRFDANQIGVDAGAGYDFALSEKLDLGLFVRWQMTGLGDSTNARDDEHWDASIQVGVSISYALIAAATTTEPEPEPDVIAAPDDRDGDRIIDTQDQCPDEAEDHDGTDDLDGCPEDDDRDGIADRLDHCRDVAEDMDGFEDTDGCPEADNDQDGTEDPADDCPLQAGPVYNGGCPEPDRDGDMVGDRRDNCPDEVGTLEN